MVLISQQVKESIISLQNSKRNVDFITDASETLNIFINKNVKADLTLKFIKNKFKHF